MNVQRTTHQVFNRSLILSIFIIFLSSIVSLLYCSGNAFAGIFVGKIFPLLMNLPIMLFSIIVILERDGKLSLSLSDFIDVIAIIYFIYLLINSSWGLYIGNSPYKVLADLYRYSLIFFVYFLIKRNYSLNKRTKRLYIVVIYISQFARFLLFLYFLLKFRFTRYSVSSIFIILYFLQRKRMGPFLKTFLFVFILLSLLLSYTRVGLIINTLLILYLSLFYKKTRIRVSFTFILRFIFIIVVIYLLVAYVPVVNKYTSLVFQRFLKTFDTINKLRTNFSSVIDSQTYSDTIEDRVLEVHYSRARMEQFNQKLLYLIGAGLGAEFENYNGEVTGQVHFGPQRDIFKIGFIGLLIHNIFYIGYVYFFITKGQKNYLVAFYLFANYMAYYSYWNFIDVSHLLGVMLIQGYTTPTKDSSGKS